MLFSLMIICSYFVALFSSCFLEVWLILLRFSYPVCFGIKLHLLCLSNLALFRDYFGVSLSQQSVDHKKLYWHVPRMKSQDGHWVGVEMSLGTLKERFSVATTTTTTT